MGNLIIFLLFTSLLAVGVKTLVSFFQRRTEVLVNDDMINNNTKEEFSSVIDNSSSEINHMRPPLSSKHFMSSEAEEIRKEFYAAKARRKSKLLSNE